MAKPIQYHYNKFPPKDLQWEKLISYVGPANAALARYDGTLTAIPNAAVLLSPLTTQEAVLSSKIEGTQATMGEVLEFEAEDRTSKLTSERKADINEILNYRKAMWEATKLLEKLPLCNRIIKEAHKILLSDVRGHGKSPGQFRKTANWIGPPGCTIENSKYIPISADKLDNGMDKWEKYIHSDVPDKLIQLAIIHAEFESLHPFLDGNGRLGRICVPLFLYKKKLIQSPMFYISSYFESHRDEYYERLLEISRDNGWTGWCKFFLIAIIEQAKENQNKASSILNLYESKKTQIVELTHSQYAIHTIDFLFERPIFKSSAFTNFHQIPAPTAKRILSILRENGIIKTLTEPSGRRSAVYSFPELLNIAEGKKVF